jgi:hypothetical protein
MHADNGGVDHLDSSIMGSRKCVYDAAPDTSLPPADEVVVACGVRTKRFGQITPGCSGAQDSENAIEDTPVVRRNATRLVRQHRLDGSPFIIGEFVAHDSSPQFGSLNHRRSANRSALRGQLGFGGYGQKRTSAQQQPSPNPSKMTHCGSGRLKGRAPWTFVSIHDHFGCPTITYVQLNR